MFLHEISVILTVKTVLQVEQEGVPFLKGYEDTLYFNKTVSHFMWLCGQKRKQNMIYYVLIPLLIIFQRNGTNKNVTK